MSKVENSVTKFVFVINCLCVSNTLFDKFVAKPLANRKSKQVCKARTCARTCMGDQTDSKVNVSLQNQNLRTDLRWVTKRIRKSAHQFMQVAKSRRVHYADTVDLWLTCIDLRWVAKRWQTSVDLRREKEEDTKDLGLDAGLFYTNLSWLHLCTSIACFKYLSPKLQEYNFWSKNSLCNTSKSEQTV